MVRLDGKALAGELEAELAAKLAGRHPCLAIVQVGNDSASSTYVKNKAAACGRIGVNVRHLAMPEGVSQKELAKTIKGLAGDSAVNGILLQLPLPKRLNPAPLIRLIPPHKDVDVFRPATLGLRAGNGNVPVPCVVGAIEALRVKYGIPFGRKRIVVVGKGKTGGGPVFKWYAAKASGVIGITKSTSGKRAAVAEADILVSAVGRPNVVKAEWLKPGCAFFDVGIFRDAATNKLRGDLDFEAASAKAAFGTPVPGGIGPLTVVSLLSNLEILTRIQDEQTRNQRPA